MKKQIRDKRLADWNKKITEQYPMEHLIKHPNPLIRLQERNRQRIIVRMAGPLSGKVVADVGCETGYITRALSQECHHAYGIDINSDLLAKARKAGSKNIVWIESNIYAIDLPDDSVDVALCAAVLEHVPDVPRALDELVRITKPGGKIVLMVPNERLVLAIKRFLRLIRLDFLLGRICRQQSPGHLHVFDRMLLESSVARPMLRLERIVYDTPFYTNIFAQLRVVKR